MTAYWVSEYREITDETKMAAYAALGRPALEGAGRISRGPAAASSPGRCPSTSTKPGSPR